MADEYKSIYSGQEVDTSVAISKKALTIDNIVQTTGPSPSQVMSQQAVTVALKTAKAATVQVGTTTTGPAGSSASVTNSGTEYDAILDFVIPRGDTGEIGEKGNGITSIEKTSSSGLIDTYTITYDDGSTETFQITNADQIDLRYINGQLQWKYETAGSWTTLFTIDDTLSTTSDNPIQNKIVTNTINSIKNNLNNEVIQNITTSVSEDNFNLIKTLINLNTQETIQQSTNIPLANSTNAGLMSSSDFSSLQDLENRVGNLEGKTTRLLYTASTNPTASDINSFVVGLGYTSPFEGIAVVVDETFHIWHYYDNNNIGWRDDGVDTVSNFTNTTAGIVKGSTENGKVFAETDGTGSVNGWASLNTNVSNLQSTTQALSSSVSTLQNTVSTHTSNISDLQTTTQNLSNTVNSLNTQVGTNTSNITNLQNNKIDINQGSNNTGKVLTVGSDGNVTPQDIPSSGGTVVNVNNAPQATINFTSDPQTQIDNIENNTTVLQNSVGGFAAGEGSSTSQGGSIGDSASSTNGGSIGYNSKSTNGGAMGFSAITTTGGAIGSGSASGEGFSGGSLAKVALSGRKYIDAIQLGSGTNEQEKTLQIYDDNIYNATTHTLTVQNATISNSSPMLYFNNTVGIGQTKFIGIDSNGNFVFSGEILLNGQTLSSWFNSKANLSDGNTFNGLQQFEEISLANGSSSILSGLISLSGGTYKFSFPSQNPATESLTRYIQFNTTSGHILSNNTSGSFQIGPVSSSAEFQIYSKDASNEFIDEITFNGKDLVFIEDIGDDFVRQSDGIQLCWGSIPSSTGTITLPKNFVDENFKVFFAGTSNNSSGVTLYFISSYSQTTSTFTTLSANFPRTYFAIGKWK